MASTTAWVDARWKTWVAPGVQRVEDDTAPENRSGLALDSAPDAPHEPPARADIRRLDDAPEAGAVGRTEATEVLGANGQRLVLGFLDEEHRRLEDVPASELH
eukprot:15437344-Alexandrium_andersonii.AAC.1